jgi:NOL1/NOP2/sun family putative RNA methylase
MDGITKQNYLYSEIKKLLGESDLYELIKFFKTHPHAPESVRINSLRYNVNDYLNIAEKHGVSFSSVQGNIPDAYYVKMPEETRVWWNQERLWGKFYSQGNASLIPPLFMFDEVDHINMDSMTVLDMAAAPGSKATQIGSIMRNQGLMVANDYKSHRLYSLHRNLQAFGVANAVVTQLDGKWVGKRWPKYFDKILLDAPCSGTGSNRRTIFDNRNEESIERYTRKQKGLLSSAIAAVNTNETSCIIYSTCSLLPQENEVVLQEFIEGNKIIVEKIDTSVLDGWKIRPGAKEFNDEQFSSQLTNAIRIYPHENDSDAFFIAKLKIIQN